MSELDERRREKKPVLCVGDATGAGGGEGSRRPKRGMFVVDVSIVFGMDYRGVCSGQDCRIRK